MLGLRFRARAFPSRGKRGPPTVTASPAAEHRLQTRRLSTRGSRAQPLCGMWDLPRPGLEPVSPALAGRLSTTAPPGKPPLNWLLTSIISAETSAVSLIVALLRAMCSLFLVAFMFSFSLLFSVALQSCTEVISLDFCCLAFGTFLKYGLISVLENSWSLSLHR